MTHDCPSCDCGRYDHLFVNADEWNDQNPWRAIYMWAHLMAAELDDPRFAEQLRTIRKRITIEATNEMATMLAEETP